MTIWTDPRTWNIGELVTKAIMDTHVRDNLKHLKEQTDTALGQVVFFPSPRRNAAFTGVPKNIGTYTQTVNSFHADIPNTARAIFVTLSVSWASAGSGSYCNVTRGGNSDNCVVARSQVAAYSQDNSGIVPLNSGQFSVIIGGANASIINVDIWGYISA